MISSILIIGGGQAGAQAVAALVLGDSGSHRGHRYFEHSSGLGDAPAVMGVLVQQVADRTLRRLEVFEAGHLYDLAGLGESVSVATLSDCATRHARPWII